MQKIIQQALLLLLVSIAVSCGNSAKDKNASVNDKKAQLEKLKSDKAKTDAEIQQLQEELSKLDTTATAKVTLVAITPVSTQNFQHFIDLQGKVDAENTSYISPRMGPAQVKAVYVREGQFVRKGQLLLKLDNAIMRQQVIAAKQQLEGIKTQLSFAKNIYQRQKNLWDQGIGTEVQLITARTNVESLENQLKASSEQVKVAIAQLNTANVYSDVSGIADVVAIRVGETFSGMGANGPQIKIVNTSRLKVVTNVPENYLTRLKTGTPVEISIPDANRKLNSKISLISQSIDPTLRGFVAEAPIPYDPNFKPNQSVIVKILDYAAPDAVVIPINVVQTDETGKYVYVMTKLSNGKTIAKKKPVAIGEVSGSYVEIKGGLTVGDQLITEGYQNLYEGQSVSTEIK